MVIGSRQLGLLVLMHEAAHWLLFTHGKANTLVGAWLCAGPVGAGPLKAYRRAHHLHHRHTQQGEDPDLAIAAAFPMTRGALALAALRDLSGWTALTALWERRPWAHVRRVLVSNAVLFGVLAALAHWELYVLLWLVPLATWYQLVARLRMIAEHAGTAESDDPLRNTRTTRAGFFARTLFAPYRVNYHLEHHMMVFVPCWKLPRAHALLLAKGYGAAMETSPGYGDVVRRLVTSSFGTTGAVGPAPSSAARRPTCSR
jgi:fatty acid desaturase